MSKKQWEEKIEDGKIEIEIEENKETLYVEENGFTIGVPLEKVEKLIELVREEQKKNEISVMGMC